MPKKSCVPPRALPSPPAHANQRTLGGIVDRSPADLNLWQNNPRTHSDKQQAQLKASMRKYG